MRFRLMALVAVMSGCVIAHASVVHAQPTAAQVLSDLGLSANDQQRVLNGEFVTNEAPATSERDLALSIAFFVNASPADLSAQVLAGSVLSTDPQVVASGEFKGAGSLSDLASLEVDNATLQRFADSRPGAALNLSAAEIASFNALRSASDEAVLTQLRQMLYARFQAYKTSGLPGIAPYDRGGSTTDVAGELRKASEALTILRKYMPAFQQALMDFPRTAIPGMGQTLHWVDYNIDGTATLVLVHELAAADGAARAVVQRQYYVSNGYNAEQAVAGFLPAQGGTVVAYTNHTFTDQVAGFGGAVKRGIGRRVMANKLTQIFETARKRVAPH